MKFLNRKTFTALLMACLLMFSTLLTACGEKDPVKYEQELEMDLVESLTDDLIEVYDEYIDTATDSESNSARTELDIELSPEALDLIEAALAAADVEMDLSSLSNISFDSEIYVKNGEVSTYDMVLGIGENELLGFELILDSNTKEGILGLPGLLEKYIKVDVSALWDMMAEELDGEMADLETLLPEAPDLSKLPDGKTIEKLIIKYAEIIINGINKVERTEATVTANGVEAPCDMLTITVTQSDARAVAKAFLTEARSDKELEEALLAFVDAYADYLSNAIGEEIPLGAELYSEMCKGIDGLLAELEETEVSESDSAIVITNYVDKDDEIIGRALSLDGEELAAYAYAENDGSFGFELRVDGEKYVVGSGTTGKLLNGRFDVVAEGIELTLSVKDFDLNNFKKNGLLNGTFEFDLGALFESMGDDSLAVLGNSTIIRVEIEQKNEESIRLVYGLADAEGTYFIKASVVTSEGSGEPLERPADENIIVLSVDDLTNEEAAQSLVMELLGSLDIEGIKEILKSIPLPEEYASEVDQVIALLEMLA